MTLDKKTILQINTQDNKGGAAKVAFRLTQTLNRSSAYRGNMAVGSKFSDETWVDKIQYPFYLPRTKGLDNWRSLVLPTASRIESLASWKQADILHYHNLHGGYFNPGQLTKISRQKPTVWTLHDSWIIQEKGITPEYDQIFTNKRTSPLIHNVKQKQLESLIDTITFTAPSLWLKNKVLQAYPAAKVEVIPNSVDTAIFKPADKRKIRKQLNLPADKIILLLVADSGEDNVSKGASYLQQLISSFDSSKVMHIVIGKGNKYISDEKELAQYYAAADLFVFPSKVENFPLVTLEAMACGTPVAAYDVGGVGEQIVDNQNGLLIAAGDEAGFTKRVHELVANPAKLQKFSQAGLQTIRTKFSQDLVVAQYQALYTRVLGESQE